MALPKWKCHKVVEADKIKSITYDREGMRWHLQGGDIVKVFPQMIARNSPKTGDYYVRYSDSYESWSPRDAFEQGYARMEETVDG
jgi:hypothetical protein